MTKAPPVYRAGSATDPGRLRSVNEDRAHADEGAGVFLVVDGMGGHAAGERAAAIAVETIPRQLELASGSTENRIRQAITAANNEIFQLAQANPECEGMACVLTLAVADGEKFAVGHVGDSRLYLAWTGGLRKLTSDHSPVGEREDRGDLTEAEAMQDPRRNEVFRDVGTRPHESSDEEFIDVKTFPFRSDAAFLLCTDGLSDALTSVEINAIIQRYDGDPQHTAQDLVEAANRAGGKDNITVIFIAGPEFSGVDTRAVTEARARHSVTRMRGSGGVWAQVLNRLLWMGIGALLGISALLTLDHFLLRRNPNAAAISSLPRHTLVNASDAHSLTQALASARAGDVIDVPRGDYADPVEMREGVELNSASPGEAVIHGPVRAHNLKSSRLTGFRIEGALVIDSSSVEVNEVSVSDKTGCAVSFIGNSAGVLRASTIQGNGQCALLIDGESSPRVIANRISNGIVDVRPPARPILSGNVMEQAK